MTEDLQRRVRLRFYGSGDYATYFQVSQAFDCLAAFDTERTTYELNDIVEVSHAATFVEKGFAPPDLDERTLENARGRLPSVHRVIGRYFASLNDSNLPTVVTNIDFQYHGDVLRLLAKYKVINRCSSGVTLPALREAGVRTAELLSCKELVTAYDEDVRSLVLSEPANAEIIISHSLMPDQPTKTYLPRSLTSSDSNALLESYVALPEVNGNYLHLLATARSDKAIGLDDKLRLKAKRRLDADTAAFFGSNEGIKFGVEVAISESQVAAVESSLDDNTGKYSYSRAWLADNLDYPTILNNFIYLFAFVNDDMVSTFPAYRSELGIFERFLTTRGKDEYAAGVGFRHADSASLLQTIMYQKFLELHGVDLEDVVAWFVNDYLRDEFGVKNFKFVRSSPNATYLEKCRHLFSETESVLKQFSLYAENGELDVELLALTSEQLSYAALPSLLEGKYAQLAENAEIADIQHNLFSDQSHICYINEQLSEPDLFRLIAKHQVQFDDFLEYQQPIIERLAQYGILDMSESVKFASIPQVNVLKAIAEYEAVNYYHRSERQRHAIDEMVEKGWLLRRSTLLTTAEKSYVNFLLNQSEFSNGPDLRNRYLHGSQGGGEDNREHFQTYIIALRTLVMLSIKLNDEFVTRADEPPAN